MAFPLSTSISQPLSMMNQKEPAVLRKERPVPNSVTSEAYSSGSRRRRTPKRRIVDLSTPDASPIKPKNGNAVSSNPDAMVSEEHTSAAAAGSDSGYGVSPENPSLSVNIGKVQPVAQQEPRPQPQRSSSQPEPPRLHTLVDISSLPQLHPVQPPFEQTSPIKISPSDNQDWRISGEMYRKRLKRCEMKLATAGSVF